MSSVLTYERINDKAVTSVRLPRWKQTTTVTGVPIATGTATNTVTGVPIDTGTATNTVTGVPIAGTLVPSISDSKDKFNYDQPKLK